MVHASEPARRTPTAPPRRLWRTPLVVGICFGLGYGITNRLLALQWSGFVQLGQNFDGRPFPGTTLESLRQKFGAEGQAIRGDLDLIELEAQDRQAQEQARLRAEEENKRLRVPEQPLDAGLPAGPEGAGAESPAAPAAPLAPQLPPPSVPSP